MGNRQWLDGGAMFGNAPRPVWEKWSKPDSLGRIPLACRALLIEHNETRILCETGIGAFFEPKMAERFGVENPDRHILLESLNKLGLSENDIDLVILSHLHFDHAGGLLPTYQEIKSGSDRLLFPNATYLVGEEAWTRATEPHSRDRASFIPGLTDKLKASGRLEIVRGNKAEVVMSENLSFFISHGHTPGQMHTVFRGDRETVVFAGDLIPGSSWVHLPITMGYDRFPELLIDEKGKLYSRAVPEKWWVFFTHDPNIAGAHIENREGKFVATDPQESFEHFEI
jgi:glyoxylase-like metal-dependent hydrolase (beta-lactamase superfamily II)